MKKVRTCLMAAALTGAVLTVSAGAAPLNITMFQGNAAQTLTGSQAFCLTGSQESCLPGLQEFLNGCLESCLPNCPESSLPGQTPSLPGDSPLWPEQTPDVPNGGETLPEDEGTLSGFEAEVVRLVNEVRQENGLQPLTHSTELSRVARIKSQDMVDHSYFSHTSPTYGTPFQMLTSFGVSYSSAGENIAYGQSTPQQVMDGWMNSPGHRANILNAGYTQLGVGYVADGNYWTQLFIG